MLPIKPAPISSWEVLRQRLYKLVVKGQWNGDDDGRLLKQLGCCTPTTWKVAKHYLREIEEIDEKAMLAALVHASSITGDGLMSRRRVQQTYEKSCGPACLSMLTGLSEGDWVDQIGCSGVNLNVMIVALAMKGITAMDLTGLQLVTNKGKANPFEVDATEVSWCDSSQDFLLAVPSLNYPAVAHFIVVMQNGWVLDPSPRRRYDLPTLAATNVFSQHELFKHSQLESLLEQLTAPFDSMPPVGWPEWLHG